MESRILRREPDQRRRSKRASERAYFRTYYLYFTVRPSSADHHRIGWRAGYERMTTDDGRYLSAKPQELLLHCST